MPTPHLQYAALSTTVEPEIYSPGMVQSVTPVIKHEVLGPDPSGSGDYLDTYKPLSPASFGVYLQLLLGEEGDEFCDSFDVLICTPAWFAAQVAAHGLAHFKLGLTRLPDEVAPGAGLWFVEKWDAEKLREAISVVIEEASPAPDFDTVANRIGRTIPWEFDYKYDDRVNVAAGLRKPGIPR